MKISKKLISGIVSVSILISLCPCVTFAVEGTEANPYLISTPVDLLNVRNDLTAYYKLSCDIDMAGVKFTPIGNEDDGAFSGTLDGAGYKIKNLTAGDENTKYAGLIGYLEGTVKNLTLENAIISGYRYVGGIAGYADSGVIENCFVTGVIHSSSTEFKVYMGGVAGYVKLVNITNCKNYTKILFAPNHMYCKTIYIGGIVGYNEESIIQNCINMNNSSQLYDAATMIYYGGITGCNEGEIKICYNRGDFDISTSYSNISMGGVAGINKEKIYNCINNSNIFVTTGGRSIDVGGIAGDNSGDIYYCSNNGEIHCLRSDETISGGGIAGINSKLINNCINSGKVVSKPSASIRTGGIVGYNGASSVINNCINSGTIPKNLYSGGIAGYDYYGIINNCISCADKIVQGSAIGDINKCFFLDKTVQSCKFGNPIKYPEEMNTVFEQLGFGDSWLIETNINSGFPQLRNMPRHIDLNECVEIMTVDDSDKLYAYIDGTSENVTWSCDDESVATVSADGIVTAKGLGACTVTATNAEGMKANCLIYVYNPISALSFDDNTISLNQGNTYTLTPAKTPTDATENVMWTSDNESVATVNQAGTITAVSKGKATITATSVTGNISASCVVNVDSPVQSISLSSTSAILNVKETKRLTATVSPAEYTGTITWSSSNEEIVTIDSEGLITAKSPGTAVVSVSSDSGKSAQCTVTVKQPSTGISVDRNEITLQKGYTHKLSATMLPANTTDTVTWSSSSTSYASVSADGTVTANKVGTATITATTTSGQKAYCVVNIVNPNVPVASVTIDKTEHIMTKSETIQLKGTVLPTDATNKELIWSTSDDNVASVNDNGVVTANSVGVATITATANNGMYHECIIKVVSASGPSIVLTSENAIPNANSKVKASIVRNPGISGYKFTIKYDEVLLTPVSVTANEEFGGTLTTNLDDENRTEFNVVWYSNGDTDIDINGELFTIDFKVSETAELGDYSDISIEYGSKDICNTACENIALYTESAKVTVEEPLPGDIYEDGDVTVYDLTLLARHITSLETFTERQQEAADVNNDGLVDILDVIRLAQYLVNWSGVELMSLDLFSISESAQPIISVGSGSVNEANEAEIPVYIKNNTGILGYRFVLDYNAEDIEILSITPSELINKEGINTNLGAESQATDGLVVSCYASGNNITDDGALFTVKVRYKNPADTSVSPISIVDSFNNIGNENAAYVTATYETGYVLGDDYIVANKVVGDTNFSCELYFDDSYAEQSAKAIIAFYDGDGRMVQLMSKDINVKPGKVDLSINYDKKAYSTYKLMIWEGLNSLKPLVEAR